MILFVLRIFVAFPHHPSSRKNFFFSLHVRVIDYSPSPLTDSIYKGPTVVSTPAFFSFSSSHFAPRSSRCSAKRPGSAFPFKPKPRFVAACLLSPFPHVFTLFLFRCTHTPPSLSTPFLTSALVSDQNTTNDFPRSQPTPLFLFYSHHLNVKKELAAVRVPINSIHFFEKLFL